jgi:hypothetical protein
MEPIDQLGRQKKNLKLNHERRIRMNVNVRMKMNARTIKGEVLEINKFVKFLKKF